MVSEQSTYPMRAALRDLYSFKKHLLRAKHCVRCWEFKIQSLPFNCSESAQKQASKQITRVGQLLTQDRWRALCGRGVSDKTFQRQLCLHRNLEKQALSEAEWSMVICSW